MARTDSRERILDAAERLYAERGLRARRCGKSLRRRARTPDPSTSTSRPRRSSRARCSGAAWRPWTRSAWRGSRPASARPRPMPRRSGAAGGADRAAGAADPRRRRWTALPRRCWAAPTASRTGDHPHAASRTTTTRSSASATRWPARCRTCRAISWRCASTSRWAPSRTRWAATSPGACCRAASGRRTASHGSECSRAAALPGRRLRGAAPRWRASRGAA